MAGYQPTIRRTGERGGLAVISDGLVNVISGLGGAQDKRAYDTYQFAAATQVEVETAYRTSWLARKIHDLPAWDMTREWRDWQADDEQIETLEAEEKRLGIRAKVQKAIRWQRLYGGGALIMGVNQGQPAEELKPASIKQGDLQYVHVVSRWQITAPEIELDPLSEFFQQPKRYQMTGPNGSVDIHPSRVIPFVGQPIPEGSQLTAGLDNFWGDPLLQILRDAVMNGDLVQAGTASLVHEAKVDTLSIPKLTEQLATSEYEARLTKRLSVLQLAKSILNARILDSEEKWETRQISFTGLPDLLDKFLQIVAAAADIPVTRLLGTSAKGLNATGEGDKDNYNEMVSARQETDLRPLLDRLDAVLIPSALGKADPAIYFTFAPLEKPDPKEEAELQDKRADTAKKYADTGLVPRSALAKAVQNSLVEDAVYPGLEKALEETGATVGLSVEEFKELRSTWQSSGAPLEVVFERLKAAGLLPDGMDTIEAFRDAIASEGPALGMVGEPGAEGGSLPGQPGTGAQPQLRRAANDAEPRPLYVSRKVVNAAELLAWARGQRFKATLPAGDLHVTMAYSRQPVDWMKVGESWTGDRNGELIVAPGGARLVEKLGPDGAVVLMFTSAELSWRHMAIREAGASWDWPEYQPHVTITYDPQDVDLAKVEPYRGRIVLGPEIFEELHEEQPSNAAAEA